MRPMMSRRVLLITAVLSLLIVTLLHAQPPKRPMVIHGEVMVSGVGAPAGSEVRVSLTDYGDIVNTIAITNGTGLSYYRIEIPADRPETTDVVEGGKTGSQLGFVSLKLSGSDIRQLNGIINAVNWQEGAVIRRDILLNQVITKPPVIINAVASKEDNVFNLTCDFSPVQTAENVSYRVAWYRTVISDGIANTTALTYGNINDITGRSGVQHSALNAESSEEASYLEVVVTPTLGNGSAGPSAYRKVILVFMGGEL